MQTRISFASWKTVLTGALLILAAVSLLVYPDYAAAGAKTGLELCVQRVIPSLFPFFVVSSMAVKLGWAEKLGAVSEKIMVPLFGVSGTGALPLTIGIVSGSPSGTRSCVELYKEGKLEKNQAQRLMGFCNNCGPAFIIGMVGSGIFGSLWVGVYLYAVHILSSLLFGVISSLGVSRRKPASHRSRKSSSIPFAAAFTSAVTGAWGSVLNVCAFVVFFSVVLGVLSGCGITGGVSSAISHILGFDSGAVNQVLTGILEMTAGISSLSGSGKNCLVTAAFILGWSGLSALCQSLAIVGDTDLSPRYLVLGKLFQGSVSAAVVALTGSAAAEKIAPVFMSVTGGMISGLSLPFSALLIGALFLWVGMLSLVVRLRR